jgi:hypothetical protein
MLCSIFIVSCAHSTRTVSQGTYMSHPELKMSDHKPVTAIFQIKVESVISSKFNAVKNDILRKLDRQDNERLPDVRESARAEPFPSHTYTGIHLYKLPGLWASAIRNPADAPDCRP